MPRKKLFIELEALQNLGYKEVSRDTMGKGLAVVMQNGGHRLKLVFSYDICIFIFDLTYGQHYKCFNEPWSRTTARHLSALTDWNHSMIKSEGPVSSLSAIEDSIQKYKILWGTKV